MIDISLLKKQEPTFLGRAKKKGYICPKCGNGSGSDGTGITKQPNKEGYKCFKCDFYGDIIDLYGAYYGIDDNAEAIKQAAAYYNLEPVQQQEGNKKQQKATIDPPKPLGKEDYTEFYKQAEAANNYSYLLARGISEDTQKAFHVGYVPNWKSPKAVRTTIERGGNPENLPTSPRCIIPRSKNNYLARDTRKDLTKEQQPFAKQNQGETVLYNLQAMKEKALLFIVEGEIDCMSIHEAGGQAVALCSTGNKRSFINYLKENHRGQRFILMLDNDNAGQQTQAELKEELKALEIDFIEASYPEGIKDPNEYLQKDKEGFIAAISSLLVELKQHEQEETKNIYNAEELLDYFRNIEEQPAGFEAKTGFAELDRVDRNFYGGLHEGLYIIGAISSLGKTTFCLQLADQVAEKGNEVIFFSLEQSKYELMAKSISRETYKKYQEKKDKDGHFLARDTMQILNNRRYSFYSPEEKQAIKSGIENYSKYASNIFIYEGRYKGERLTVQTMNQIVKNHIKTTGKSPVVFVDYLQIIAPTDIRATDKQNTDTAVFELKELSRNLHIPVFAISSFNRDNYNEPVSMASFKESGAIEYSSDILLGLQYAGMDYIPKETENERKQRFADLKAINDRKKANKEPVEIELKCLKNRNGTLFTVPFDFVAAFNTYEGESPDGFKRIRTKDTPFTQQQVY